MDPLVSVDWLAEHMGDRDVRVFDATIRVDKVLFVPFVRSGHRDRRHGHIPGSAFADLFALSDTKTPRRWHDKAGVLDGGWGAWQAAGRPTCGQPCAYKPATFVARLRSQLVVGKREVLMAIDDPRVCLVNALGRRQHRGEVNEYGRRGHIPGSRNFTAWEILDRETGRYRSIPQLREKLGGILDAERVITYCGAGAAAASLANVLVRLGHTNVAIYDGGLMEWCADRSLPLEVGE